MSKTQSVILNLNKEYANSKASDYLQPVAQQLDIGSEAEVALYGAVIKRKPIFIDRDNKDNTFNWSIDAQVFPDNRQVNNASSALTDVLDVDKLPISSIEEFGAGFKVESGGYSVNEYGKRLVDQVNSNITNNINGQDLNNASNIQLTCGGVNMVQQFPYSYTFENSKPDEFYLGFQGYPYQASGLDEPILIGGKLANSQLFDVDNNEATGSTGGLFLSYETEPLGGLQGCTSITANTAINVTNYSAFSQIHSAPIKSLFRKQTSPELEDPITTLGENESYFEFNLISNDLNNKDTDYIVGFTNTFLQSGWASTTVPALSTNNSDGSSIPEMFLGVRVLEEVQSGNVDESHAEVFIAANINEYEDYLDDLTKLSQLITGAGYNRVCKIDMDERLGDSGKMGFRFYAVDNQMNFLQGQEEELEGGGGQIDPSNNRRYPRAYGFQFYFRPVSGDVRIVYDSKHDNLFIPSYFIDDGFCFNAARSQRSVNTEKTNLGFQPYIWVNKLKAGDGILVPRGNYVAQKDNNENEIVYRYGLDYYSYNSTNANFNEVMGLPSSSTPSKKVTFPNLNTTFSQTTVKRFDGNAFPDFKNQAGLTKLYSDSTQYNIELNLPVNAYTTTQPNVNQAGNKVSNLGQKRTIIYKAEPVLDGELQGVQQTFINKNVLPNNLKYLTINNEEPLNINELNVQIRRSKTNEIASELEDASVEILVKSN